MSFYRKRRSKSNSSSSMPTKKTSSGNSPAPRTPRFVRSNSEQPPMTSANLIRSSSTLSLPVRPSTRVTRSSTALLRLKQLEESSYSASESGKDICLTSDDYRDNFSEPQVKVDSKDSLKILSKLLGVISYDYSQEHPVCADIKSRLNMPLESSGVSDHNYAEAFVNVDKKVCLKMHIRSSSVANDDHSPEHTVNFDCKTCLDVPLKSFTVSSESEKNICVISDGSRNGFLESHVNADSKVILKMPFKSTIVNTDSKDCLKMLPISSAVSNNDHSPEHSANVGRKSLCEMPPSLSAVISDDHSPEDPTNAHNEDLRIQKNNNVTLKPHIAMKKSPFRMDEDFDIDTFLKNNKSEDEEVRTTTDENCSADSSDDDFLDQFPKVDVNKINKPKQQPRITNQQLRTVKGRFAKDAIAKNAIAKSSFSDNSNPAIPSTSRGKKGSSNIVPMLGRASIYKSLMNKHAIATSNTQVKSNRLTPTIKSNDAPCNIGMKCQPGDYVKATSSPPVNSSIVTAGTSVKRCLDVFLKNDIENRNPKKQKFEISPKNEDIPIKPRSPFKDIDMNLDEDYVNSDIDMHTEYEEGYSADDSYRIDGEEAENILQEYQVPNLAESIDFDVRTIRSNVHQAFGGQVVGDKRWQIFRKERMLTDKCILHLFNSLNSMPTDAIERDPEGLMVQLMPHQKHALKWMRWREEQKPSGGIIADDMGLGKTIQMISLILASKIDKKNKAGANGFDSDDTSSDEDWRLPQNDDESRKIVDGKTLVVCPASILGQWEREIEIKCKPGMLRVVVYYGHYRTLTTKQLAKYDVVLTTYTLVQQERDLHIAPSSKKSSKLFKIKWERVILDEAHYIRNDQSKISISACELSAKINWAITGTPIQNKKSDFYALLKFVKCSPFDSKLHWQRWVGGDGVSDYKRLKVITASLMLRRTKAELAEQGLIQSLPDKTFELVQVDLDLEERIVYQKLLLYSQTFFNEFLEQREDREHKKKFGWERRKNIVQQEIPAKVSKFLLLLMKHHVEANTHYILVLITRLRQMCCHPFLIKSMIDKEDVAAGGAERCEQDSKRQDQIMRELDKLTANDDYDDCDFDEEMAQRVLSKTNRVFDYDRRGSKVRAVLDLLHKIIERGEKVVVVSQWTSFLRVIANNLNCMEGANYEMFTGLTTVNNRQNIVDRLNDRHDDMNVLLLSLTAGGVGLNLVGANNLLLIDLHWNPQLETQAMDRIHRFGQRDNVHIYKFVCRDTIEDKIKALQDRKLKIAQNILTGSVGNRLTIEDLKHLFS